MFYKNNLVNQSILLFKTLVEPWLCNNLLTRYTFFINLSTVIFLDNTIMKTSATPRLRFTPLVGDTVLLIYLTYSGDHY